MSGHYSDDPFVQRAHERPESGHAIAEQAYTLHAVTDAAPERMTVVTISAELFGDPAPAVALLTFLLDQAEAVRNYAIVQTPERT